MKLKIVNLNKFIRSFIIISLILIATLLIIGQATFSHADIKHKTIAIISGDTLWNIALNEQKYNEYYSNKDIRYIIEDLKKINFKNNVDLQPGEKLIIPTF